MAKCTDRNKVARALLLCIIVLSLVGITLLGIAIFSPTWWTLDVTEYGQARHTPPT